MTPLINLTPNMFVNMGDGSGLVQLVGQYDFQQDWQFLVALNLPFGSAGTEFGGLDTPVDADPTILEASIIINGAFIDGVELLNGGSVCQLDNDNDGVHPDLDNCPDVANAPSDCDGDGKRIQRPPDLGDRRAEILTQFMARVTDEALARARALREMLATD